VIAAFSADWSRLNSSSASSLKSVVSSLMKVDPKSPRVRLS
jgi:hypothetical protein